MIDRYTEGMKNTDMGTKMDARQYIRIRGANENNLKNIRCGYSEK